jgi:hypothetical protein
MEKALNSDTTGNRTLFDTFLKENDNENFVDKVENLA